MKWHANEHLKKLVPTYLYDRKIVFFLLSILIRYHWFVFLTTAVECECTQNLTPSNPYSYGLCDTFWKYMGLLRVYMYLFKEIVADFHHSFAINLTGKWNTSVLKLRTYKSFDSDFNLEKMRYSRHTQTSHSYTCSIYGYVFFLSE